MANYNSGIDVASLYASLDAHTKIDPEHETLNFSAQVEAHLNKKIDYLILQMNENSENYNSVTSLVEAVTKAILKDNKTLDFNTAEFKNLKQLIDDLREKGILDDIDVENYKLDSITDMEVFKAKLEGLQNKLRNQSQIPLIQLQPLMNLLELMIKIAKAIIDNWANFKNHVNSNMHG